MTLPSRIMDLDSHEMIPLHMWDDEFEGLGTLLEPMMQPGSAIRHFVDFDVDSDSAVIGPDTVWIDKGPAAPGAISLERRLETMDAMGVERQLMFPGMGGLGASMATAPVEELEFLLGVKFTDGFDFRGTGRLMVSRHNDWVLRNAKDIGGERIRPLAIVLPDDLVTALAEAERLIANGARGVCMPSSLPPGGVSPADARVDPLWRLFADNDVPVTLHLANDWGFMRHAVWGRIPAFARSTESMYESHEFPGPDPYWGATMHLGNENWLTSMIIGGVFERHPDLRFGVIENGAIWAGPLADRLDTWAEQFAATSARTMSMKPSEYMARNVRVTPLYFEKVDEYFERWPHLRNVFSFASDYPHPEGGKETARKFNEMLTPLGDDILDDFFTNNGELLLPA